MLSTPAQFAARGVHAVGAPYSEFLMLTLFLVIRTASRVKGKCKREKERLPLLTDRKERQLKSTGSWFARRDAEYSSNVATFPGLTSGSHEPPSTCADGESSSNVATFPGLTSEPYAPHEPPSIHADAEPSFNVATFPGLTSEPYEPHGPLSTHAEPSSNVATFSGLTSEPYEPHGPLSTRKTFFQCSNISEPHKRA
ncbi:unnamed protein product [Vitrella brassicaformis CCMP3155]|uniref:Uncharacterized protein n=1 Tax=Vitrella brassicaformis (strain CCMP3155) TaxID=1169540 RepID=A0A0G4GP72_VITBC|nr:unnamed protein product [Vitrella brassicaformis CCMP3155]|eukprot:CEM32077.1 unnamed protein product [Vitrella brassicaformis CCMP3155]